MPAKDPLQAQRDLIHRIHTVGLPAAFEALVGVCKDPKAQASSKATAGTTLFRAGGLFDKDAKRGNAKPHEEMTAEEIAERLAELRTIQGRLAQGLPLEDALNGDDDPAGDYDDDHPDSPGDEDEPKDVFA